MKKLEIKISTGHVVNLTTGYVSVTHFDDGVAVRIRMSEHANTVAYLRMTPEQAIGLANRLAYSASKVQRPHSP